MGDDIILKEKIIIDNKTYEVVIFEDGTARLKRYDDKYKMWVILNFSNEFHPEIDKLITNTLSKIFLDKKSMSLPT